MQNVRLKKTTIVDVQAARITSLLATLDNGVQVPVTGAVSVGDWQITDDKGAVCIMSDADFQADQVV